MSKVLRWLCGCSQIHEAEKDALRIRDMALKLGCFFPVEFSRAMRGKHTERYADVIDEVVGTTLFPLNNEEYLFRRFYSFDEMEKYMKKYPKAMNFTIYDDPRNGAVALACAYSHLNGKRLLSATN